MLYALKQVIFVPDHQRRVLKATYITVQMGLTWQQAKAERNRNRTLSIVPAGIAPALARAA